MLPALRFPSRGRIRRRAELERGASVPHGECAQECAALVVGLALQGDAPSCLHEIEPDVPPVLPIGQVVRHPDGVGAVGQRLPLPPCGGGQREGVILLEPDGLSFLGRTEVNEACVVAVQGPLGLPAVADAELTAGCLGVSAKLRPSIASQDPVAHIACVGEDAVRRLRVVHDNAVAESGVGADVRALCQPPELGQHHRADAKRRLAAIGGHRHPAVVAHADSGPASRLWGGCPVHPCPIDLVRDIHSVRPRVARGHGCQEIVLEPDWAHGRPVGYVGEAGVTVGHLLHPVLVQHDHRRRGAPWRLRPPALEVAHPVVELERMDLQQIEVHHQRGRHAGLVRPSRPQLRLHSIEAAAPVPVRPSLPEHRPLVCGALVLPQPAMDIPYATEHPGAALPRAGVHVEPWRHRGMDIDEGCVRAVPAMDLR